ncbi:MAG: EFR1 family ferrodoxin, partial [Promethearchaeota archaeon]
MIHSSTNRIFYFSGTGNSLKVSIELAQRLKNTLIRSIPKVINGEIKYPIETAGIVFPVYFNALPPIVADFIKVLDLTQINYLYAVATYHRVLGATFDIINDILEEKGKYLNASFALLMPGNYIPLYEPSSREAQKERLKNAKQKVSEISKTIENRKDIKNSSTNIKGMRILQKGNYRKIPKMDRKFWVKENCNNCGICEQICPVQNIKIINNKPRWHQKCQQCTACLNWCPQEAIQYGKTTEGRARYHNPEITLKNFLNYSDNIY